MELRIQKRQTGKTYGLIQELKKNKNAIMIVPTQIMKEVVERDYKIKGRVFSIREIVSQEKCKGRAINITDAYIDELDLCLNGLIGLNIKIATLTGEK